MSVRVIADKEQAALYCSTSEWAFGPIFHDDGHTDAGAAALCFLHWWDEAGFMDPRTVDDATFEKRQVLWLHAISGGQWTGSLDSECLLCHGDLDFPVEDDAGSLDDQPFDMSGSTRRVER